MQVKKKFVLFFMNVFLLGLGGASSLSAQRGNRAQVWVEAASFTMGDDEAYREESSEHRVSVDGFWIDTHEVSNAQFARFVEETGYVTIAERKPNPKDYPPNVPPEMLQPGSVVFIPPGKKGAQLMNWWRYVPGANWKYPQGPNSSIKGKENYPVVHVAYEDAQTYAEWAGRSLPTEAQFELAARSKKEKERYAWGGDELAPQGKHRANTWQGMFPLNDAGKDGFKGPSPVASFEANDYGIYDLIGNVWEWTSDWYAPRHDTSTTHNPQGVSQSKSHDAQHKGYPIRVIKGGSFLCADNFCRRYRPSARQPQDLGLGTGHLGFRTVSTQEI